MAFHVSRCGSPHFNLVSDDRKFTDFHRRMLGKLFDVKRGRVPLQDQGLIPDQQTQGANPPVQTPLHEQFQLLH